MIEMEMTGDMLLMFGGNHLAETRSAESLATLTLVEAAKSGDENAFRQLYKLYASMVRAVLLARVPYGEADDLMQDVFITAYEKLPTLRDGAAFGAWLATIARNRATGFHRQKRETEELNEDFVYPPSLATEVAEVLDMIRTLPEDYAEALVMRLVEGMTGPEIAARTGLQPAYVRIKLHRGMKMLRERLGVEKEK